MEESSQVLSKEQVYAYINQYKAGDINARNIVIEHNIELARKVVKCYFSKAPYEENDLISVGLLRLIEQLDRFDPKRELEFSSWATVVIKNAIRNYLTASKKHIVDSLDAIIDVEFARDEETQLFSVDEVMTNEMDYYRSKSSENVDEENEYRKEFYHAMMDDYSITMQDTLRDSFDFTILYEDEEMDIQTLNRFYEFLSTLSEGDRKVVVLYFGLFGNQPHTSNELESLLEISHTTVCNIVKKALVLFRVQIKCSDPTNFSLHKVRKSK